MWFERSFFSGNEKEVWYVRKNGEKKDGSPVFRTIAEALSVVPADNREWMTIRVEEGVFEGPVSITKPYIILEGAGEGKTVITGNLGAYEILDDGKKRGTFRTQTVFLHAHDVILKDLTIENTAGPGKKAGQAIALYADGDRLVFDHVALLGNQDTLFTGPLPEKEIEPGGFRGPLEHAPRIPGRHYYTKCRIEGNVDFIFGGAAAYFEECEIFCRNPEPEKYPCREEGSAVPVLGYITAASTPEGQKYGYVFSRCRLTSDCPEGSCMLGRPWRDFASVVFLECELGDHIAPAGWDDWGKEPARKHTFFAEYASGGEGKNDKDRAGFARILSGREADDFKKENILSSL